MSQANTRPSRLRFYYNNPIAYKTLISLRKRFLDFRMNRLSSGQGGYAQSLG